MTPDCPPEELRLLTLTVLSRVIGNGRNRHPATHGLCRALALFAREEAASGRLVSPAPAPEMHVLSWPASRSAQKKLDISGYEHYDMFQSLWRGRGAYACFSEEFIDAFVPRELWPVLDRLIADGPALSAARARNALCTAATLPVRANRRREAGTLAAASLQAFASALERVFAALVALRGEQYDSDALEPWQTAPRVLVPDASKGYDVFAPDIAVVRAKWNALHAQVRTVLGAHSYEEELAVIARLGVSRLHQRGLWEVTMRRALLAVYVITGGRKGAVSRLTRADVVRQHHGPPPDRRSGAALRLLPAKTLGRQEQRMKPIPDELLAVLDSWTALVDRFYRAAALGEPGWKGTATPRNPGDPVFPADGALFPRTLGTDEPLAYGVIGTIFSGRIPSSVSRNARGRLSLKTGQKALIPRVIGPPDELIDELTARLAEQALSLGCEPWSREHVAALARERNGHSLQEFRHLAYQLAGRAGEVWNSDHPASGTARRPEPEDYAPALLDHKQGYNQRLRRIYGDLDSRAVIELLSGRAIEVMWKLLTTDLGSIKQPDVGAYRDKLDELVAVEADLDALDRRARGFHIRPALHRVPVAPAPPKLPAEADDSAKLNALLGYAQGMHGELQTLRHQLSELQHIGLTASELTFEAVKLSSKRAVLVRTLDELRFNEALWMRLPEGECAQPIDWTALEARSLGHPVAILEAPAAPPLRDWLTAAEVAEIAGVKARSTVSRWVAGTHLPADPHERPWDAGQAPIDVSQGERYRRFWAQGFNAAFWETRSELQLRRRDELLAAWPEEKGWMLNDKPGPRCLEALRLPKQWANAYLAEALRYGEPELGEPEAALHPAPGVSVDEAFALLASDDDQAQDAVQWVAGAADSDQSAVPGDSDSGTERFVAWLNDPDLDDPQLDDR